MHGLNHVRASKSYWHVGERGLRLKGHKAALGRWLGAIEETQGHTKQALEAWLAAPRSAVT